MNELTFRMAVPGDEHTILDIILELARYEKLEHEVVATPELLHEWLFEKEKAEVLLAEVDGIVVGSALFFQPGSIWRTYSCVRNTGAEGMERRCCRSWLPSPWSGAVAVWNGPAWTGTNLPSISTPNGCTPFPWMAGRCTA